MTPSEQEYPEAIKVCTTCLLPFPISGFYKDKRGKFGVGSTCRKCSNKVHSEWCKKNRATLREKARVYSATHREQRREYQRRYNQRNPETYAEKVARKGEDFRRKMVERLTFSKYGMTKKIFLEIAKGQQFKCSVCGIAVPVVDHERRKLYVDHDHQCCGKMKACKKCVRGLVCHKCNLRMAAVDDLGWLIAAINYVNRFRHDPIFLSVPSEQPQSMP